jgi:hypothetical protein
MFKYAQTDTNNVVIGISYLSGEVEANNLILISEDDKADINWIYDKKSGKFSEPII